MRYNEHGERAIIPTTGQHTHGNISSNDGNRLQYGDAGMMMKRVRQIFLLLSMLLGLTSCGRPQAAADPTPFPAPTATPTPLSSQPLPIAIPELAAYPTLFEGVMLELTGAYRPLPRLICNGEAYPGPATWGLVDGGLLAYAGGFDEQLRPLLPAGLEITVTGRWQAWRGPIGCGKQAQVQEIWYLQVSRIVAPSPLTAVTLTPAGVAEAAEPEEISAIATPALTATGAPIDIPEATTTLMTTPPITSTADIFPTPGLPGATPDSPGATPGLVGATPAATPTTPAALQTPAPPGATFTPSPTSDGRATPPPTIEVEIIEQGEIAVENLKTRQLAAGAAHRWTHTIFASESITVTAVAADARANLVISLWDPEDNLLVDRQDKAPADAVETLVQRGLSDGRYTFQIEIANNVATDYALMVLVDDSENLIFQGMLRDGDTVSGAAAENSDHYWHFLGNAGQRVSLLFTTNDVRDLYVELYNPNGSSIETINQTGDSEDESLENYTLPSTGLYAIRVGELDFLDIRYTISINFD
jgi:hypothetical protein